MTMQPETAAPEATTDETAPERPGAVPEDAPAGAGAPEAPDVGAIDRATVIAAAAAAAAVTGGATTWPETAPALADLAAFVRENPAAGPAVLFRYAGMMGHHDADPDGFSDRPVDDRLAYTLFHDAVQIADRMLLEDVDAARWAALTAPDGVLRPVDPQKTLLRRRPRRGALSALGQAVAREDATAAERG